MKRLLPLLVAALVLLPGQGCRNVALEEGVSLSLARERLSTIGDPSYDLFFSIPSEKDSLLHGRETLSFTMKERGDLVLDFRVPGNVLSVKVGTAQVPFKGENEHIIIGRKFLRKGENTVTLEFIPENQSLNRRDDYLYTLLVPDRARTLFPCFDQPDMKARFTLSLELPEAWKGVCAGELLSDTPAGEGRHLLSFHTSDPISTYLFAFAAGEWSSTTSSDGKRSVTAYYRESDPEKLRQLPKIFSEVFFSLDWMEEYTGIPLPFRKYDFVVVPGFQFGGMEHPGAIFFNDRRVFLAQNPTVAQQLSRLDLIAHETAHMWFGDLVTMSWFNDVWTKEVFANYFSSQVTTPLRPDLDATLRDFSSFTLTSYEEDRTRGSVSVRQSLPNLRYAGLIYGNSVYDKAPVVMRMLSDIMTPEPFQEGLREYLRTYSFSNATWDGLISILDKYTPTDLSSWSSSWVDAPGLPTVTASLEGNVVTIRQDDPLGRGLLWPQKVDYTIIGRDSSRRSATLWLQGESVSDTLGVVPSDPVLLLNLSALSYGYFPLGKKERDFVREGGWRSLTLPKERLSLLSSLYEDVLRGRMDEREAGEIIYRSTMEEEDPVAAAALLGFLGRIGRSPSLTGSILVENWFRGIASGARCRDIRVTALRSLFGAFRSEEATRELHEIWRRRTLPSHYSGITLSETDYMTLAYELSLRMKDSYEDIRSTQRERILNKDRVSEFDFIIRSVDPDRQKRDSLFRSFLAPEGRRTEPWVASCLRYLNHPIYGNEAVYYIRPALDELENVHRTGDIFFPKNWCSALLSGHRTRDAAREVEGFLSSHEDYPALLRNKVLQTSDHLLH